MNDQPRRTGVLHSRAFHSSAFPPAAVLAAALAGAAAPASRAHETTPATLPDIKVQARRASAGALDQPTRTGSRLELTPLQTPASIEVLSGDAVRERGDTSVLEAVSRATGITASPAPGNGGSALSARGFVGHGSVMQLFDGTRLQVGAGTVTFPFDAWSIERIEVLRGAASVLFGEGAIGAAVNIVPKKPSRQPAAHEALLAAGSDSTRRAAFGSGGALDERWSYRLDISHHRSGGFMDRGDARSLAAGGSLQWDLSPTLGLRLSHDEGHQRPQRYFGVPLVNGRLDERNRRLNYNVEDAAIRYRDRWTRLEADWAPNEQLRLRNQLYRLESRRHWRNTESYAYLPDSGQVLREDYLQIGHDQEQVGNRLDVALAHPLGRYSHRAVLGLDLNRIHFRHATDAPYGGQSTVDLERFDPGRYASPSSYRPRFRTRTRTAALFMEDRLVIDDHWSLVGGLRRDHVDVERHDLAQPAGSFDKTFAYTTGRLGVVWTPSAAQSVYAQLARAVDPLGGLVSLSPSMAHYDLTTGRQLELGYKQLLDQGRGAWSVALYRIEKRKLLSRDPHNPALQQQIGQQSSQGVEATVELALARTLRLEANLARLHARYDDFDEKVGRAVISRAGKTPPGVPQQAANLWLHWRPAPGWQARSGLRHVGRRQVDTANSRQLGAYTVVDAALAWLPRGDLEVTLQVDNVFDRDHALSTSNDGQQWLLGRPRSVELSAHLRF